MLLLLQSNARLMPGLPQRLKSTPDTPARLMSRPRGCSRTASTANTRLKRALLIVLAVLPLLIFSGCFGFLDRGFRFHGEYEAPHSGFRIEVMARGYVKGGHDIAKTAFAVARFCPLHQSAGRSFELSLLAEEGQWIKASCRDFNLNHAEWNWKTADSVLQGLLSKAGVQQRLGGRSQRIRAGARWFARRTKGRE